MYVKFKDIYSNPKSTDKTFLGHTYLRWSSFCKTDPLENMVKLDIPILLVSADNDKNAQILGLDYAKLEFLKLGKDNLTYWVYPNCDHYFYNNLTNTDMLDELMTKVLNWLEN